MMKSTFYIFYFLSFGKVTEYLSELSQLFSSNNALTTLPVLVPTKCIKFVGFCEQNRVGHAASCFDKRMLLANENRVTDELLHYLLLLISFICLYDSGSACFATTKHFPFL